MIVVSRTHVDGITAYFASKRNNSYGPSFNRQDYYWTYNLQDARLFKRSQDGTNCIANQIKAVDLKNYTLEYLSASIVV